jgi:hypothetical protein
MLQLMPYLLGDVLSSHIASADVHAYVTVLACGALVRKSMAKFADLVKPRYIFSGSHVEAG